MKGTVQNILVWLVLAVCAATGAWANAQTAGADSLRAEVSLVTCYPGSDSYEVYGHTMIRVQVGSEDLLFNYGVFNFQSDSFLYRFVKGECDYMVAAYPFRYLEHGYKSRKIVEQTLNLTEEEKREVISYLWWNAQPENATYRYGWAYDNCATRPRDIIESALGERLHYGQPSQADITFRQIMAHYGRNYPWQQFGIDLVLGWGLDHKLTYREQMFSPIKLMEAMAGATVEHDGASEPLVSHTNVLVQGSDEGAVMPPTPWPLTPLCVFGVIAVVVISVSVWERRRGKLLRWLDTVTFVAFALTGMIVAFLTFVSTHYGTSPNVNILWVHPLAFVPAIGVWIKRMAPVLRIYHIANAAVIVLLAALWWVQPQVGNAAFIPMAAISLARSANWLLATRRK